METMTLIEIEFMGQIMKFAKIDNGDGSFTTMTQSEYEAQQVEHLTEIVTDGAAE